MAAVTPEPTTLLEAVRYFSDPELAFTFVRELRWPDGKPVCPHCGAGEPYFFTGRRIWKCRAGACRKQFSLKVGTIFEDSPLGWDKWLPAMWLIGNAKNSISSHELARSLGVTQKTAWFVLHRIRKAMASRTFERLSGTVEADETYWGGAAGNMHASRRAKVGSGPSDKMAVTGQVQRGGPVQAQVATDLAKRAMHRNIRTHVEEAQLSTPTNSRLMAAWTLSTPTRPSTTVRNTCRVTFTQTRWRTLWSLLKRALKGAQVHVSREHLPRYVTERAFAYNNRLTNDLGRMQMAVGGIDGRRVTWKELTYKPRSPYHPWR